MNKLGYTTARQDHPLRDERSNKTVFRHNVCNKLHRIASHTMRLEALHFGAASCQLTACVCIIADDSKLLISTIYLRLAIFRGQIGPHQVEKGYMQPHSNSSEDVRIYSKSRVES